MNGQKTGDAQGSNRNLLVTTYAQLTFALAGNLRHDLAANVC